MDLSNRDPMQALAVAATNLKSVCRHILENEKVKPNYETTINYYHQVVMESLEMIERMQASIDRYNDWGSKYGEDQND
jgi:hypothetical protein